MPCDRSALSEPILYPWQVFKGRRRKRPFLRVVHAVPRSSSVVYVLDQPELRPEKLDIAVIAPFVESLQRPKEIVGSLQPWIVARTSRNGLNVSISAYAVPLPKPLTGSLKRIAQRRSPVRLSPFREDNPICVVTV